MEYKVPECVESTTKRFDVCGRSPALCRVWSLENIVVVMVVDDACGDARPEMTAKVAFSGAASINFRFWPMTSSWSARHRKRLTRIGAAAAPSMYEKLIE